ncbi:MAG: HupE/UreJ family protein [Bacteroidetes bacterium]|nr:HupE/UreJ family protein [Bacteroidota bacterium]
MNSKKPLGLALFVMAAVQLSAHTINYQLERVPIHNVVWYYLVLGYKHILPDGFDHILFVAGLCLLSTNIRTLLWQATAFTVAHTLTLILSMKNIIVVPPAIVEPIIALSIAFIAIENIVITELKPWRVLVVFAFGLVHGMGFASALNELGLPRNAFYTSLISFNVGVELGQATIILGTYFSLIYWFGHKPWYRRYIVYPLSGLIALVAIYWTIVRLTA